MTIKKFQQISEIKFFTQTKTELILMLICFAQSFILDKNIWGLNVKSWWFPEIWSHFCKVHKKIVCYQKEQHKIVIQDLKPVNISYNLQWTDFLVLLQLLFQYIVRDMYTNNIIIIHMQLIRYKPHVMIDIFKLSETVVIS